MPATNRILPLALFLLMLHGCAPGTQIVTSWRDTDVTIQDGSYNKVLVICLLKDETTRRTGEDHMVRFMNGHGVASYRYLGGDLQAINGAGMNERMVADGIDGVVIMRLVDQNKEQTYVPGTTYPAYYASPWGYYGHGFGYYSTPGYITTTTTYTVETNVYSTRRNGLIWTGTTTTVDPSSLEGTVDDVMQVVYDRMIRDGLIVKTPAPGR